MAGRHPLDDDCWRHVLQFLLDDHHTYFQLLLTSKTLFRVVVPVLYRRPLFEFKKLSHSQIQNLEKLLFAQLDPSVIGLSSAPHVSERVVDYYSFVQEMPDRPVALQAYEALSLPELKTRLDYLHVVGSKVKKHVLYLDEFDSQKSEHNNTEALVLVKQSLLLLENLQDLEIQDHFKHGEFQSVSQSTYDAVSDIICHHQSAFSGGALRRIQYLRFEQFLPVVCDPKMMVVIRDSIANGDGRDWITDTLDLRLPPILSETEETTALLTILTDPGLPKQLKNVSVRTRVKGEFFPISMTPIISTFLSRCRDLDSLEIESCLPEFLAWAEQERSLVPKKAPGTGPPDTSKLAHWKSVTIRYDNHRNMLSDIAAQEEEVFKTWFNLLRGFRHSIEYLSFTHLRYYQTESPFKLSLPLSMGLFPRLEELKIYSGEFGEFSGVNLPKLRNLWFDIYADVTIDMDPFGPVPPRRKFPKSVQDLNINHRTLTQMGIGLLEQMTELQELTVQRDSGWNEQTAFGQNGGNYSNSRLQSAMSVAANAMNVGRHPGLFSGQDLQQLTKVTLSGYAAQYLGIEILLLAHNIQDLWIIRGKDTSYPPNKKGDHNHVHRTRSGCCDIGNGNRFLPLNHFFMKIRDSQQTFPKLRSLKIGGFIDIQPWQLIRFLSLPMPPPRAAASFSFLTSGMKSTAVVAVDVDTAIKSQVIMFPKLKHLALGSIQNPRGGDTAKEFVTQIHEGFSFLEKFRLEGSVGGHDQGTLSNQSLFFRHCQLEESTQKEWHGLLSGKDMGFEVLSVEQKRSGLAIQLNDKKVVYQRKLLPF